MTLQTPSDPINLADSLSSLHIQLLAGQSSAADAISDVLLPALLGEFRRRYPTVDGELIFDAVVDETMSYVRKPVEYPPEDGASLDCYIARRVRRRIWNALRSADRRRSREQAWADLCVADFTDKPE
jgi:DNA-directed RNA polymerase specialized sigma24 family protein